MNRGKPPKKPQQLSLFGKPKVPKPPTVIQRKKQLTAIFLKIKPHIDAHPKGIHWKASAIFINHVLRQKNPTHNQLTEVANLLDRMWNDFKSND